MSCIARPLAAAIAILFLGASIDGFGIGARAETSPKQIRAQKPKAQQRRRVERPTAQPAPPPFQARTPTYEPAGRMQGNSGSGGY